MVVGRDSFLGDPLVRQAISFFRFLLHPQDLISLGVCLKAEAPTAPWVPKLLAAYRDMDKSLAVFTDLEKQYQQEPEAEALARFLALVQHYGPLIQKEKPAKLLESWIKDHDLAGVQSLEHLHHTAVLHPKMPGFLQNLVLGGERDVAVSYTHLDVYKRQI